MFISNHKHIKEYIPLCFLYIYKCKCYFTPALLSNQFKTVFSLDWEKKENRKTTLTAFLRSTLENTQ